jgi:hypothetical protein
MRNESLRTSCLWVKGSNKSEKPTLIRNDDGTAFESINDKKNCVGSYYKKIYKKIRMY